MSHNSDSLSKETDTNIELFMGFTSVLVIMSVCAKLYE